MSCGKLFTLARLPVPAAEKHAQCLHHASLSGLEDSRFQPMINPYQTDVQVPLYRWSSHGNTAVHLLRGYGRPWKKAGKPNPGKTQICSFHLKNRESLTLPGIEWSSKPHPIYQGVTSDPPRPRLELRSPGAHPSTLSTSAFCSCFSAAEYACPVRSRSCQAENLTLSQLLLGLKSGRGWRRLSVQTA